MLQWTCSGSGSCRLRPSRSVAILLIKVNFFPARRLRKACVIGNVITDIGCFYLPHLMKPSPVRPTQAGNVIWRRVLILLILAVSTVGQFAKADIVSDMIGSWISDQTVLSNGAALSGVGSAKVSRYGSKGLYSSATVIVAGVAATGIVWMHDSGTVLGYIKQGTKTVAVVDGTWKISGKKLIQNVSVRTLEGDYTQVQVVEKLATGRLQSTSSTSSGLTIVGTLRRK
jgi:hypothetical protein